MPCNLISPAALDAFLTKVGPTGRTLMYSTYLGGSMCDYGYGSAVDERGTVYVTGLTMSDNFPTTRGAFQPVFGGGDCAIYGCADTFVMKFGAATPMPVDDGASDVQFDGWAGSVNLSAFGLGYRAASAAGRTLTYHTAATATAVSLITYRGPDQGKAQVIIDGVNQGTLGPLLVGAGISLPPAVPRSVPQPPHYRDQGSGAEEQPLVGNPGARRRVPGGRDCHRRQRRRGALWELARHNAKQRLRS